MEWHQSLPVQLIRCGLLGTNLGFGPEDEGHLFNWHRQWSVISAVTWWTAPHGQAPPGSKNSWWWPVKLFLAARTGWSRGR